MIRKVEMSKDVVLMSFKEFEIWFEDLDDDYKEVLVGFFRDGREKIVDKVIRKNKLEKLYEICIR